jgi:hypothetical protein
MMRLAPSLSWIALFSFGCSTGASRDTDQAADLKAKQQRWEAAAITDYRFDFQQQCFCVPEQLQPVTIEVRNGHVARVVSRETGQDVVAVAGLRWYTVPDLFRVIAEAQQQGVTPLVVRYDSRIGYPTHIEAGSLAADAGTIYTASDLRPLSR